ncbi:uncharacterized mitochondrial protein-like protein [Tanacetum coccineum]
MSTSKSQRGLVVANQAKLYGIDDANRLIKAIQVLQLHIATSKGEVDFYHMLGVSRCALVVGIKKAHRSTGPFCYCFILTKAIVEQEVKGTVSSSSSSKNLVFVSSTSSTNEVNTAYGVSTANTQVSTASTQVSTANLSDDTVYAFLASQPNGSHLVHEDLEQIHKDDLEEMDLKWQLALLSRRTRKFFQKTGRKITINRSDTTGYDNSRRTINVEEISSKAMLAIDGAGFDWSFMTDEEVPTDMALVAFSDSKLEKLKQERENNQLKIEKFNNASKSLDKLIGIQILDKSRKGLGFASYNAVPPPPTGLFSPPNLDLSNFGLEEFQQPEFEGYGPKTSKSVSEDTSNEVRESPDALLVEELVSNDKLEKKTVFPTTPKINFIRPQQQEKLDRKPVKYAEIYSFNHVQANCNHHQRERIVSGNNYTRVNYNYSAKKAHPSAYRNIVPRVVLIKTGLRPLNTARSINTAHPKTTIYSARPMPCFSKSAQSTGHPQKEDQGYVDSRCSRHMTGNMSYLSDVKEFDRGYVTFGGGAKGGRITGKGTLKIADESQVLLKVPRKKNMYSVDMKDIVPKESLTCLVAKAILDESILWHRRLGHVNFKTINKLVKDNLVKGLPIKRFENDQTYVACLKGKQHKASFVIDDYSRFTWVFFLASKDETSSILKSYITQIENLVDKKVKIIRCDNGIKFKNRVMSEFCEKKGIKREFSIARTPQQNSVAKTRNRTLIEAARTMLADSKLPTTFWAEAVNTSCYVQNRKTIVANYTTKSEYVAAASCCGQILWIQNQMGDYGYNFMNTKIFIDNESIICIVKNPVFYSKTKHIKIRHHFIRDSNDKKLIQMIKIHTNQNVTDLLTKAFDVGRFQYLIATNDEIQVSTVGLPYYYALTKNPTIYVSLIEKFWQTITVRTVDNRDQEIIVTVDGKEFTIIEASVRRHLQQM